LQLLRDLVEPRRGHAWQGEGKGRGGRHVTRQARDTERFYV
jgi:hypothetical protein